MRCWPRAACGLSKLRTADDLLVICHSRFRARLCPSIASVARVTLERRPATMRRNERSKIAGGKILHVDECRPCRGNHHLWLPICFQHAGRASFSRRVHGVGARHSSRHALRAGSSGKAFRADLCHTYHRFRAAGHSHRRAALQIFGKDTLASCCPWRPKHRWSALACRSRLRGRRILTNRSAIPAYAAHGLLLKARVAKAEPQLHLHLSSTKRLIRRTAC